MFVHVDADRDRRTPQRPDETRGLHRRAVAVEHRAAKERRMNRELVTADEPRLLRRAGPRGRLEGLLEHRLVRRPRGDGEHAAFGQPHVVVESANGVEDTHRLPGDGRGVVQANQVGKPWQSGPEAVQKAAVPPARTVAAAFGFDEHHARGRRTPPKLERGPEAGIPATDDHNVRVCRSLERGQHVVRRRLVAPPGCCLPVQLAAA